MAKTEVQFDGGIVYATAGLGADVLQAMTRLVREFDKDGSGQIEYSEFKQLLTRHPACIQFLQKQQVRV